MHQRKKPQFSACNAFTDAHYPRKVWYSGQKLLSISEQNSNFTCLVHCGSRKYRTSNGKSSVSIDHKSDNLVPAVIYIFFKLCDIFKRFPVTNGAEQIRPPSWRSGFKVGLIHLTVWNCATECLNWTVFLIFHKRLATAPSTLSHLRHLSFCYKTYIRTWGFRNTAPWLEIGWKHPQMSLCTKNLLKLGWRSCQIKSKCDTTSDNQQFDWLHKRFNDAETVKSGVSGSISLSLDFGRSSPEGSNRLFSCLNTKTNPSFEKSAS